MAYNGMKRRSMDGVRIELNEDEIEKMTADQKLGCLLKIAFANHNKLLEHDTIFWGNGSRGILSTLQAHSWILRGVCISITVGAAVIGYIIRELMN